MEAEFLGPENDLGHIQCCFRPPNQLCHFPVVNHPLNFDYGMNDLMLEATYRWCCLYTIDAKVYLVGQIGERTD
jgi:hypothetical protein